MSTPALGLLEFDSVAAGIAAGDAMVKRGPVAEIITGTVHPGRYLVMVTGDVASVSEALIAGREVGAGSIVDEVFLSDAHPSVVDAVRGTRQATAGEALGVVETTTVAATIEAADGGVKGADVVLMEVHLADDLGGKAYALFTGTLPDVEAAVAAALGRVEPGVVVRSVVVPMLDDAIAENLLGNARFRARLDGDS